MTPNTWPAPEEGTTAPAAAQVNEEVEEDSWEAVERLREGGWVIEADWMVRRLWDAEDAAGEPLPQRQAQPEQLPDGGGG